LQKSHSHQVACELGELPFYFYAVSTWVGAIASAFVAGRLICSNRVVWKVCGVVLIGFWLFVQSSIASAFYREQEALDFSMDPYAKPKERKVGAQRPKITHLPKSIETRTRRERQAEKQAVAAERRAIKKSARRHLKRQLLEELKESE